MRALIAIIVLVTSVAFARAEEPVDVQLLSSRGEHYKAMLCYERLPKRKRTPDSMIAAARSAWALSLPEKAIDHFTEALETRHLGDLDTARVMFSRAIIEFQEGKFQVAALYADRALSMMPTAGPLRAKAHLLRGQSDLRLGNAGSAHEHLQRALDEASIDDEGEIRFQLGEALWKLSREEEAREHLRAVPVTHDKAPQAIRRLAHIALQLGQYPQADHWLSQGKEKFPDQFIDSWVTYAQLTAALEGKDLARVRLLRDEANKRFAPSDFWLSMVNAAAELAEWRLA